MPEATREAAQTTYTLNDASRECRILPETAKVLIREHGIPVVPSGKSRWVLTESSLQRLKQAWSANKATPYAHSPVAT